MFKKLKQKIENVESPVKDSPTQETRRGSMTPSGSRARTVAANSNLFRSDSLSSLNGSDVDMQPSETSSREDLYTMLMSRTTQVKRMEVKLAEYGQSLKERSRQCEKLSATLEKQQDNALRKLNELNETYAKDKQRYESTINRLEESENNLTTTTEFLIQENERHKSQINSWQTEKDEFEQKKQDFFEKRDNSEELHDLQMQEIAKLKHMFMNSEKESKQLQIDLDENVADLIQTRERNDELESTMRQNQETLQNAEASLTEALTENEGLKQDIEDKSNLLKKLSSENVSLKDKLSCLALDLQKTRSNLSSVETKHSSLSEKYLSLKHSCEALVSKNKSDSEEQMSLITHLQDKIKLMEKRSNAQKLPQDEQMQAFLQERSSLEAKLEEARQQLVNIKSTWSDKINFLENQVSHLNSKIAEDSQEITCKTQELEELQKSSSEKLAQLTRELTDSQEQCEDLTTHNNSYLQQVAELEAKIIEHKAVHDLEIGKCQKHISDLEDEISSNRKTHLIEVTRLSDELDEAKECIVSEKSKNEAQLLESNEASSSLKNELEALRRELDSKDTEIGSRERVTSEMAISLEEVRNDRDQIKKRNRQLEEELEARNSEVEEELEAKRREIEETRREVESLKSELRETSEKLQEAERKHEESSSRLNLSQQELEEKSRGLINFQGSSQEKEKSLQDLTQKVADLEEHLESRTVELMTCKEEIASLKNHQSEESSEVEVLRQERSRMEDRLLEKERSLKLSQQRLVEVKKALQKELNKQGDRSRSKEPSARTDRRRSSSRPLAAAGSSTNGHGVVPQNGIASEPIVDPIPSLLSGDMSLDDPSISEGQRDVVVKYLKHVVLRFLSCGQSEAQQLVKAMSMILRFTKDEEKLVREILDYRTSWFGSRPSAKNVIKPSFKGKGSSSRHKR